MVVIGVDAHKRSHTLVAADELGRKLGERTVGTTSDGHLQAVQWAAQWPQVRFALEDCPTRRAGQRRRGAYPFSVSSAGCMRPIPVLVRLLFWAHSGRKI